MQTETNGVSVSLDERIAQLVSLGYTEDKAEQKARDERARDEAKKAAIAPPGSLGLPVLLEAKRIKYNIPDFCFKHQAVYDRCFAYQPEEHEEGFFGGGILMPDDTKHYQRETSPRVILLSAGLTALDNLRSNGIDIGHTVVINQMTPYRFEAGAVCGKVHRVLIIRDGEVCGSEELSAALAAGQCRYESRVSKDRYGNEFFEHVFVDREGRLWDPQMPFIADDG